MDFRYRYVDFGTVFFAGVGDRAMSDGWERPGLLHGNEIAVDVGGVCWGYQGEQMAVIDHHFSRINQFPSATAAVLHYAAPIRRRFLGTKPTDCIWLVTHRQPDFDAFCSMYMLRSILEDNDNLSELHKIGIDQVSADELHFTRINWFNPKIANVPLLQRWRVLLGVYASRVDNSQRLSCPPNRALHSVLYAALARGRDYGSELSGAVEFFKAARSAIQERNLNPLFDSVLEGNASFEPELAMLDRERDAYHRDIRRARMAIVSVPKAERPFAGWFKEGVSTIPLLRGDGSIIEDHLRESGQTRIPMDGIYLHEPECILFKEWARLDVENSSLGRGFTFTAVTYSAGRPDAFLNQSDYIFALDPEMAYGCNLYALWAKLQAAEIKAIRAPQNSAARQDMEDGERQAGATSRQTACRVGFLERAGSEKAFFSDPWFDGSNYFCTIVPSPNRGTYIGRSGVRSDLIDDPVVAIVRGDLESSLYSTSVMVEDISMRAGVTETRHFQTGIHDCSLPTSSHGFFRLAIVQIDNGVKLEEGRLADQIGAAIWKVLNPDADGMPTDFLVRHLLINADWVGVWSRRGIAMAFRKEAETMVWGIAKQFREIVGLVRDSDAFLNGPAPLPVDTIVPADMLLRREAILQQSLALPESRLLSRFFEAIQIGHALHTLRDVNHACADRKRNKELDRQTREFSQNTKTIAHVQTKLEWLEVFFAGIYATEVSRIITELKDVPKDTAIWIVVGSGVVAALAILLLLRPWEPGTHGDGYEGS